MAQKTELSAAEGQRRPRDRKQLILRAASELFCESGYYAVGVDDIAAKVGITGGAIYRHFADKHDLLAQVVFEGIDHIEAAVEQEGATTDGPAALRGMLRGLAANALDWRDYPLLWQRESRHLSGDEQARLRHLFRAVAEHAGQVLRSVRSELSRRDSDLLVWSTFAVYASPAFHRVKLRRTRFESLLYEMGLAVCSSRSVRPGAKMNGAVGSRTRGARAGGDDIRVPSRASRREMLLGAAIHLFAQRGYPNVTMDDIGRAAGISGPSIYGHFSSKTELLVAAHTRGAEHLEWALSRALIDAESPSEALELIVDSYVGQVLAETDLIRTLITEVVHLPASEHHLLRRIQHDYLSEWVRLLRSVRPELSEPEARIVVHAVLSIFNDIARIPRLRTRPDLRAELVGLGLEVLTYSPLAATRR